MRKPKPRGYWTKSRILAAAKKYKHKSDFKRGSPTAHRRAKMLGIYRLATLHMTNKPLVIKWSAQSALAEARRYKHLSDFNRGSPGAYAFLVRQNLLGNLSGHFRKKRRKSKWAISDILAVAKEFETRTEFARGGSAAYKAAQKMGVLERACKHMRRFSAPAGFWTRERILKRALRHKTRTSFIKNEPGPYRCAVKLGILDEAYAHMKRIGSKYRRALYAFEFEDRSVYVGLTFNYDKRHGEHLAKAKWFKKKGKIPYRFVTFDRWYSNEEAATKEAETIEKYRRSGWTILNSAKAGGLGKDKIWSARLVRERAKKFRSMYDFRTRDPKAYSAAARLGLLKLLRKHLSLRMKPHGYWTPRKIRKEAIRFNTRSEFQAKSSSAFGAAKRMGILDSVCVHMTINRTPNGYWTIERIKERISKYTNYADLLKGEKAAVSAARRLNVLKDLTSCLERNRFPEGYWTRKRLAAAAKKHRHRVDFFKHDTSAYNASRNLGILEEICSHMIKKESGGGKKIEVMGVKFPSMVALERHYSLRRGIVKGRLKLGWTIEEAVGLKRRIRPGHGLKIKFRGMTFPSRNALCRHYGVPERLVEARCGNGWTLAEALGLKYRKKKGGPKPITIQGNIYPSLAAACRAHELDTPTIQARLSARWTVDQAFELAPPPKRRVSGTKVVVAGKEYESISAAANAHGLDSKLVDGRLRAGWTAEEAIGVKTRKRSKMGRQIVFQGVTYPSFAHLARAFELNPQIAYQRIWTYGWSLEEALGVKKRGKAK